MKKAIIIFVIFIIYFLIYFLQVNFFNWFTIAGIKPNLFVIFILFVGLFLGGKIGAVVGFVMGLYTDFLFSQTIGKMAILFCLVGMAGGFLDKKFPKDSKITMVMMGSLVTALFEILLYAYNVIVLSTTVNLGAFMYILAIEIVYNAFLTIIFYPILNKYGNYAEQIFKNNALSPRYF